jgi:hypothetical protein
MARLLFVDDNIRSLNGHYLEMASLMCEGACQLGYDAMLATHDSFRGSEELAAMWSSAFTGQRMLPWSLGVDGQSRVGRDLDGRPIGGTRLQNLAQSLRDRFTPADRRPSSLLKRWANELTQWLTQQHVSSEDTLVLNTGDDFQLLALAQALGSAGANIPGNIHVIFHFAIRDSDTPRDRIEQLGEQVRRTLSKITRNTSHIGPTVHLHATTEPLAKQMREAGIEVKSIPYPIRYRQPLKLKHDVGCVNILLGGLPRREKGTKSISAFLSSIYDPYLIDNRFRISLQLPQKKWKRIVPRNLHEHSHLRAITSNGLTPESPTTPLNVITTVLGTSQYQDWLDTAELGLFLYEPQRYVARCSGILLELMMRGVPVLVPDQCWLADQVRSAESHGSIGHIYRTLDEVPELLHTIACNYQQLRLHANRFAKTVAARHHPTNTLLTMGIEPALQSIQAA